MKGKLIDSSKQHRHAVIEDSMNDVIDGHQKDVGPVDLSEVAALQRKIGVEVNARGVPFTPGELITATGIVMEEVGAKPPTGEGQMMMDRSKSRVKRRGRTTYFFFGSGQWKGGK